MSVVTLTAHMQREVRAPLRTRSPTHQQNTGLALSLFVLSQHSGRAASALLDMEDVVGQLEADIAPPRPVVSAAVILQASSLSQ